MLNKFIQLMNITENPEKTKGSMKFMTLMKSNENSYKNIGSMQNHET